MRIIIFMLLAIMLWLSVKAQNDSPLFRKHALGVNFSNDVTSAFRNYETPDYNSPLRYGYAVALLYQYRPLNWLSLETGIEHNSTTYYLDNPNSNYMDAWDGTEFVQIWPTRLDFGWRTQRIAIPLNLRWHYQKNRWSAYIMTGAIFTINWSTKHLFEIKEWEWTAHGLKHGKPREEFGIGITTAIGAEYRVTDSWMLRFEPRFRLYDVYRPYQKSTFDVSSFREMPWAFGLNLGLYYQLGK